MSLQTLRCKTCGSFPEWDAAIVTAYGFHGLVEALDVVTPACMRLFSRKMWGDDTDATIAKHCGITVRQAQNWLSVRGTIIEKAVKDKVQHAILTHAKKLHSERLKVRMTPKLTPCHRLGQQ